MKNKYRCLIWYLTEIRRLKSNLAVDLKNSGNGTNRNIIYLASPFMCHLLAFLK